MLLVSTSSSECSICKGSGLGWDEGDCCLACEGTGRAVRAPSTWVIADPLPAYFAMPTSTWWQRQKKKNASVRFMLDHPDALMWQMTSILERVEAIEIGGPRPRWAEMRHIEG